MRLRLVHQLSLLMLCAAVLAVSLMAGVVAWNLHQGFLDYLEARDAERLDRFKAVAETVLAREGLAALRNTPEGLGHLLDELALAEGYVREPEPPPPPPAPVQIEPPPAEPPRAPITQEIAPAPHYEYAPPPQRYSPPRELYAPQPQPPRPLAPNFDRPPQAPSPQFDRAPRDAFSPDRPPRPPRGDNPPRRPPRAESEPQFIKAAFAQSPAPEHRPPPPEARHWGQRLSIEDTAGRVIAGREKIPGMPSLTRDLAIEGQRVATARLYLPGQRPELADERFLARQYRAIGAVAAMLVLLSLLAAWWIARRWVRPIYEMQAAARRIARGEFFVRLAPHGEDELADLTRHMNTLASSLEKLEKARRQWIAALSHELRTPLAVLRGELEALQDGIRTLDAGAINSLQSEVGHITRLVDDLHQIAMWDLKKMPCEFQPTDGTDLVRQALARIEPRANACGIEITAHTPDTLPAHWDAGRITQLINNLLENSLKYTDAPGRIVVTLTQQDSAAQLVIEDTPPGVRDFEYAGLFEPLYRADLSRSRAGGSGLGLAIVAAIAQAHGGRASARASTLGGVAMEVVLPLNPR